MRRLAAVLAAAALSARAEDPAQEIREADIRAHVEFLAGDELEGRATLQRGCEVAAAYIAAQMRRVGLAPAGSEGTFFQEVPLWVSSYKYQVTIELDLVGRGDEGKFRPFQDFSIAPGCGNATADGDIVFAGYGITAPEHGYDDYAGVDARGKVVAVFRHEPRENDAASPFEGKENSRHASFDAKIANAREHGATAILIFNDPLGGHEPLFEKTDLVPDTFVHRTEVGFEEGRHPKNAAGGLPAFFLSIETAARILQRTTEELRDLQESIDFDLKPRSFRAEGRLRIKAMTHGRLQTTERKIVRNVAGVLAGKNAALQEEVVVVGAHYDHLGAFGSGPDRIYNGADDNASGVAGMLEIAEAMAGARPDRTVVFVAFVAEEIGLLGSRWYADNPLFPLEDTVAMVNLDMIGRDSNDDPASADLVMAVGFQTSPAWRPMLEKLQPASGLRIFWPGSDPGASDHQPFRDRGVPVLFFHTGFHRDYHKPGDHADRINFPKARAVSRLAWQVCSELAGKAPRPEFRDPAKARPVTMEAGKRVSGPGVELRELSEEEAKAAGWGADVRGLRVLSSKRADLKEGDVVIEVNDLVVGNAADFVAAMERVRGGTAALFVLREKRGADFVHLKGAETEGWK
jgi:hypothetical protein